MKFFILLTLLTFTVSSFAQHGGHRPSHGRGHSTPSHGRGHYNPGHYNPGHYNPGHYNPGHYNPGHYNPYPSTRSCIVVMVDHHNTVLNTFYGHTDYYTYRCDSALEQCFDEIRHRGLSSVRCHSY